MLENAEGDEYVALSKTRRVTVREFKGKVYVDIRDVSESRASGEQGEQGERSEPFPLALRVLSASSRRIQPRCLWTDGRHEL